MALINANGLNLRVNDFGEADRYVSVLTADHGLIEVFARGARRSKSALLKGTEIFTLSSYVLFEKNERYTINSTSFIEGFIGLQNDLIALTCAAHLAEVWLTVAQPGVPLPELYVLAVHTLHALSIGKQDPLAIVRACEVRVLGDSGFAMPLDRCGICGVDLSEDDQMTFSYALSGPLCRRSACRQRVLEHERYEGPSTIELSRGTRRALSYFLTAPLNQLYNFELTESIAKELDWFVPRYLQDRMERAFHKLDFLQKL